MGFKNSLKKILPPLLWAGFIFYLSSIPSLKSPFGLFDIYLRKGAHIAVYFILTLLIAPNFKKNKLSYIFSALIASLYGISDEYHQSFVPGRYMTISDMAWNGMGTVFAYMFLNIRFKNEKSRICNT